MHSDSDSNSNGGYTYDNWYDNWQREGILSFNYRRLSIYMPFSVVLSAIHEYLEHVVCPGKEILSLRQAFYLPSRSKIETDRS